MKLRLEVREQVLVDIEEAAAWYERKKEGLGTRFSNHLQQQIVNLPNIAELQPIKIPKARIRWIIAEPFPFRIFFRIDEPVITVLAVIHTARSRQAWRGRLR